MIPKLKPFLKVIGVCVLLLLNPFLYAQKIFVPKTLEVAGIKLRISEQAQRLIEKKIIGILKQKSSFEQKLYKSYLYLPVIEEILIKEKVPKDYKYLALQISALNPRKYNKLHQKLGLWQIAEKDIEIMHLTLNEDLDDRMNVITSTKAVAKRLYRSNQLHFKNWIINILSLQMGEENAKKYIRRSLHRSDYLKAQVMSITQNNHDFLLTFLAIKVLYDDKVKSHELYFKRFATKGQTLKKISKVNQITIQELIKYNPHIKNEKIKIPEGQSFQIIIPQFDSLKLYESIQIISNSIDYPTDEVVFLPEPKSTDNKERFPEPKTEIIEEFEEEIQMEIQNEFHIVRNGENLYDIARKYGIRVRKLRNYNHINQRINRLYVGQKIYLIPPRKTNDAKNANYTRFMTHHIVSEEQTLYKIAKMYNVRTEDIKRWNNLKTEKLKENQELIIKKRNFIRRLQHGNTASLKDFPSKIRSNYHKQNLLKEVPKKH